MFDFFKKFQNKKSSINSSRRGSKMPRGKKKAKKE